MEVGDGVVLGQDHGIDATVVVEVAGGQAAADAQDSPGRAGLRGDVDQPAVRPVFIEPAGHARRGKTAGCR